MSLNFDSGVVLFLSSEQELAMALGISIGDLRAYRNSPERVPPAVLEKLGQVLIERGKGMQRVGEILGND